MNLNPKKTPSELLPNEKSPVQPEAAKNETNKLFKALKWLLVANPITLTAGAVLSPTSAGKGSSADEYLADPFSNQDATSSTWTDYEVETSDDSDETQYDYFYRAMSLKELGTTGGSLNIA